MLLQVENLVAGYGQTRVLQSLSIKVHDGGKVGLFGPNGHGKTTLLRTISGLIKPEEGHIRFHGQDITNIAPREIVKQGLIHVPQGNTAFPRMTVLENLKLGAYSDRAWDKQAENLEKVFDLFPRLAERRRQRARTLSGGERQMLSIGIGLMGVPRLLMLDEPTLGLAPLIREYLEEAIVEIAKTGVTMIVVDQDIELLLGVCQHLYLVEKGQISFETDDVSTIKQDDVMEMYFGRVAP